MTNEDSIEILNRAKPMPQKMLYSRKDAAWILSISVRSIDHIIARGLLQTRKIGNRIMIPHGALVKFASKNHAFDLEIDKRKT